MTNPYLQEAADEVTLVAAVCDRHGNDPGALIEILHDLQDEIGRVPQTLLPAIAKALNLSRAEVHGVVSFYHDFHEHPSPQVTVKICRAEACQSMGALELIEQIRVRTGTGLGETGPGGDLAIEPVYCLGNCALSPAALVNGRPYGRLSAERLEAAIQEARS